MELDINAQADLATYCIMNLFDSDVSHVTHFTPAMLFNLAYLEDSDHCYSLALALLLTEISPGSKWHLRKAVNALLTLQL